MAFIDAALLPLISAGIGAGAGSLGATLLGDALKRKSERRLLREKLVNNYLLQLQDAVESLWGRLINKGALLALKETTDPYFERSTLYALACLLAYNRILLLDGVYSQIEIFRPGLGVALRKKLQQVEFSLDAEIPGAGFYRYNRIALAETVMERVEGRWIIKGYLEFNNRYEKIEIQKALIPAKSFVLQVSNSKLDSLLKDLMDIAIDVGKVTGITPSIQEIAEMRLKDQQKADPW